MLSLPANLLAHLTEGGTLLVPTRARRRAVQLAYATAQLRQARTVWPSPQVLTVRAWVRQECEQRAAQDPQAWPRALSASEEWLLWRQAATAAARGAVFFDEGLLARALQQAAALAADYGLALSRAAAGTEAGLLYEAQRFLSARCAELNAADHPALLERLTQAPRGSTPLPLLAGFTSIPPRLAALTGGECARPVPAPARSPQLRQPTDAAAELEAIAAWCHARLAACADARLLVLLPGPPGRRARLATLIRGALRPQELLAANPAGACVLEEGGEAIAAQPLIAQALTSLALLSGATFEADALRQWLLAPYWERPAAAERAALALHLSESAVSALNLRELQGLLQLLPAPLAATGRALDAQLRAALLRLGAQQRLTPRRWCERFARALAALSWPNPSAAAPAARLAWQELLESYAELEALSAVSAAPEALALLRELAQHTAAGAAGADAPVTVSGALTDPVVHYDGIWLGSLSADVLPQPLMPDPFLALPAQLAAGIPQASEVGRSREAATLLAALKAATTDLQLSVPAREGDLALLPTPLVSEWPAPERPAGTLWLPARLARAGLTESVEDARAPPWNPLQPLPGGTRALTLQSACAFRAFAELRLGALDLPLAAPGVAMDQRGLLLHAALQTLWERLGAQRELLRLAPAALEGLIRECVAQAAQALLLAPRGRRRRRTHARTHPAQLDFLAGLPAPLERECRRAVRLIGALCALERTRGDFTVLATEAPRELALGGGRLRMRLDRIDETAAGQVILDYKSGRAGTPDWYGEHPTHPQLLAYLAALGDEVVALATVNVTAREVRFCGVAAAAQVLPRLEVLGAQADGARPSWAEQRRAWRELLERLIRAFLAGEAAVEPAPGACDYCHLGALCRIGAHALTQQGAPAGDADE
ncbi:MAG TPA: PD-(D/E)XK nuclease family protein [Steroidobacteraceae bacterium]|nr:PD-(D/E)XK nuclease family protein [Steroidobacteraceae bacterium]